MSNSYNHFETIKENELNYHARKKGRPCKSKKFSSSPLHQQCLSTLVISSRCRSSSNNSRSDSANDSIIWLNQIKMDEPQKILIMETADSAQMLIVESQEDEPVAAMRQQDGGCCQEIQKGAKYAGSPARSENHRTSILICGEDEDLLWINQQELKRQNWSQNQAFGSTQPLSYFQEQAALALAHGNGLGSRFEALSNIEELSSRAEDDLYEHLEQEQLCKAPILPQTQPLLRARPQKVFHQVFDQKNWITKQEDFCSPLASLSQEASNQKIKKFKLSNQNLEASKLRNQNLETSKLSNQKIETLQLSNQNLEAIKLKINVDELFSQSSPKQKSLKKHTIGTVDMQKQLIFQNQLKQLSLLTKNTSNQYKSNIEQIMGILEEERHKLNEKLARQQREMRYLKCSLKARTRILSRAELREAFGSRQIDQQDQIRSNSKAISRMLQIIKRK